MSDNLELYHHGVKGMKWGIRRNRKSSGSSKSEGRKKQAPKESSSVKSKIGRGSKQAAQFLKENKSTLIKSGVIIGLAAAGFPAAGVAINTLGNLKASKQVSAEKAKEAELVRDEAVTRSKEAYKKLNEYNDLSPSAKAGINTRLRENGSSPEEYVKSLENEISYWEKLYDKYDY